MSTAAPALADALAHKATRITRCIARARSEHAAARPFATDYTHQDAAVLNVQRACELAIDMANMVIMHEGWGVPQSARDAFGLLHRHAAIDADLRSAMQQMVGFRNIAVHQYQELDPQIAETVITVHLDAVQRLAGLLLARYLPPASP